MIITPDQRKELRVLYHNARVNTARGNFLNVAIGIVTMFLIADHYQLEWYGYFLVAFASALVWGVFSTLFGKLIVYGVEKSGE